MKDHRISENAGATTALGKSCQSEAQVTALVEKLAELVPDAFNIRARGSSGGSEKQDMLWNTVYDAFGGKVVGGL